MKVAIIGSWGIKGVNLMRNITIIEYTDMVLAFWDGLSHGTKYVIDNCKRLGVPIKVFIRIENK